MKLNKYIFKKPALILFVTILTSQPASHTVYAAEAHAEIAAPPESASENLTLELQGVNILDVFKILSKKSGLNIVAGKNVQGQVSMFLQDVPVREALSTILQSQNLASIEEGKIIKVMTEEEFLRKYGRPYEDKRVTKSFGLKYASAEVLTGKLSELRSIHGRLLTEPRTNSILITEIPEVLKAMEVLISEADQPQETKVFKLRFAKAEDLEPKLKSFLEGSAGKIEIDKRSNRIVIVDIPSRIEKIGSVIHSLDSPVPQVLIEAKIVEVDLTDAYRQGINWSEIIEKVGSFDTLEAAAPFAVVPPAGAAALTTLALGSGQDDLQVVISLLEQVGKTNLLSSPRITVVDNEEAKLAVATRQPFVSQTIVQTANSTNTADNVQFIDVGVTLKVQPRISHDRYVEMKILPEVSTSNSTLELQGAAEGSNTTFTRTRIPVVTTQQLETTVLVKSGTTLIVGGLIQERQDKSSSRVPIIGSLPLLGRLFQSRSNDFSKTELVAFLTPTILRPIDSADAEESRFIAPDGSLRPFDQVAGYAYQPVYNEARHIRTTGEVPYWEENKPPAKATEPHERTDAPA